MPPAPRVIAWTTRTFWQACRLLVHTLAIFTFSPSAHSFGRWGNLAWVWPVASRAPLKSFVTTGAIAWCTPPSRLGRQTVCIVGRNFVRVCGRDVHVLPMPACSSCRCAWSSLRNLWKITLFATSAAATTRRSRRGRQRRQPPLAGTSARRSAPSKATHRRCRRGCNASPRSRFSPRRPPPPLLLSS